MALANKTLLANVKLNRSIIILIVIFAIILMAYWQIKDYSPRQLGPYIERRAAGHRPVITDTGRWLGQWLVRQDRGNSALKLPPDPISRDAGAAPGLAILKPATVRVTDVEALRAAMGRAEPGQVIELAPGRYVIDKAPLSAARAGTESAPVTVQASSPDAVTLAVMTGEGIAVTAPHWVFQNLSITGNCRVAGHCEHAFHISGQAHHFTARHNTVVDFNAHIKVNGVNGIFPDNGLLEANVLRNSAPRRTAAPVTPVDIVGASDWVIRRNVIADFVKAGGDGISYGAFAKGAGERNQFVDNRITCEEKLHGQRGQRVGLSLGGGGTGARYCRDGRCIVEQQGGIVRGNVIAACSDDGIYLNGAAASIVEGNTLIDTGGITVRFAHSSADVRGNRVDGLVRSRDGGVIRASANATTSALSLYLGRHPIRDEFMAASAR